MSDTKFDRDPEALAWARSKVEHSIARMRKFEEQASHSDPYSPERERQWRMIGNIMEADFIGGEGCVIAAFDARLPDLLARMSPATPPQEGNTNGP